MDHLINKSAASKEIRTLRASTSLHTAGTNRLRFALSLAISVRNNSGTVVFAHASFCCYHDTVKTFVMEASTKETDLNKNLKYQKLILE